MDNRSSMGSEEWRPTSATSSQSGAAMNWIVEHILTYPKVYCTLPLRTTYILNSTAASASDFRMTLLEHIASLPSQPLSLPPSFLCSFIKKCFPEDVNSVSFDQALTALDYLRNLEERRQRDYLAASEQDASDPRVLELKSRVSHICVWYNRALVGLRKWALIHELEIQPFRKYNCIAMLNTLYPLDEPDINHYLQAPELAKQRQQLWRYVTQCEKNPSTIDALKRSNGGWKTVHDSVHSYLRLAVDMIGKSEEVLSRPQSRQRGSIGSIESIELEKGSTLEKIVFELGGGIMSNSSSERSSIEPVPAGETYYDDEKTFYE
ncbi:hypothetical protein BJ508DRAFT_314176 [Ascobolus immersus RN42]|uniref:Uncharacterized protein n=1 Tax=Ascobolus immersus RN42 TaxID=1160509 RepID=A0A3N4HHW5_ASCIM|nr:hypothetical protein BJ508DRAFT_314176 [Ascobolus immersus RN42]